MISLEILTRCLFFLVYNKCDLPLPSIQQQQQQQQQEVNLFDCWNFDSHDTSTCIDLCVPESFPVTDDVDNDAEVRFIA